jgi:hypothetical protein
MSFLTPISTTAIVTISIYSCELGAAAVWAFGPRDSRKVDGCD